MAVTGSKDALQARMDSMNAEEHAALNDILESNGWDETDLLESNSSLTSLEMFLTGYHRMLCLDLFPHLTSLQIIGQNVPKLEHLDHCTALQRLWVVEGALTRICNLSSLRNLTHLYLYSNQLRRIENLAALAALQVLWLADNEIREMSGLGELERLQELNLASNPIEHIGTGLERATALQILNLADTSVTSLREIDRLVQLPALTDLHLNDPHWGASPVGQLANYQTLVLYRLPRLKVLDSLLIVPETVTLAESTFMKKQMFYNMRHKALVRALESVKKDAQAGLSKQLRAWYTAAAPAVRQCKRVRAGEGSDDAGAQRKRRALHAAVEAVEELVRAEEAQYRAHCRSMQSALQVHLSHIMLELETAGNVRLTNGDSSHLWYASCCDLVRSRFVAADAEVAGFRSLHVQHVAHVHNRALSMRLDAAIADYAASETRPVEWLFWAEPPEMPGELEHVIEHGFRAPEDYLKAGLHGAIPLFNSVLLADYPRFSRVLARDRATRTQARFLVCRTFLADCPDEATEVLPHVDFTKPAPTRWDGPLVSYKSYCGRDAMARARGTLSGSERCWYLFRKDFAVPEYIVSLEYTDALAPETSNKLAKAAEEVLEELPAEVRLMSKQFGEALAAARSSGDRDDVALRPLPRDTADLVRSACDMQPAISASAPKRFVITQHVLEQAGALDAEVVDFSDNCIKRIENMHLLTKVQTLNLAFNELLSLDGLYSLSKSLRDLDVSYNHVRSLTPLSAVSALTRLDASHNAVCDIEDVNSLRRHTSSLVTLDLRMNPITQVKSFQGLVVRRLPHLRSLNGLPVSDDDRHCANTTGVEITQQLLREASVLAPHTPATVRSLGWASDQLWGAVEGIALDDRRLRRLEGLTRLTGLKRASFADNELTSFAGLSSLTTLTMLNYANNMLTTCDGVDLLTTLRQLSLSGNRLHSLTPLSALTALTQLCIEDNGVAAATALAPLTNLMELYAGNNALAVLKDLVIFTEMPKLIILDLKGNPLCDLDDYYLYAVYKVRQLRMLDGEAVSAASQAAAKSKYMGRLTLEFLEDKAGHTDWSKVQELDISNLRIRDVGTVFEGNHFPVLSNLNLSGNMLTSVTGILSLNNLHVLCLNGNRLGTAVTTPLFAWPPRDGVGAKEVAAADSDSILPCLQVLQLGDNKLATMSSIAWSNLGMLRSLFLQSNQIQRVEGLSCLTALAELVLDRNRIKSIDPESFQGLTALRELRLEENSIRQPSNLSPLSSLQALYLGYNRIVEVSDIERLSSLTQLLELSLASNPLMRKQGYRTAVIAKLPYLQVLDGVEITPQEQAIAEMQVSSSIAAQAEAYLMPGTSPLKVAPLTSTFSGVPPHPTAAYGIPGIHLQGTELRGTLGLEGVAIRDRVSRTRRG